VLLTGASSGIGWALALALARSGARLLVTARREQRLRELVHAAGAHAAQVHYLPGDLVDPALRSRLIEQAAADFGALDLLINNAGVGAVGPFESASPQRFRQLMELNLFAPAELTRLALPLLRAGRRPMIVNVSSVLGHVAVPWKSEYCASKFALRGWSDALRCELRPQGIDLLVVSPNTTRSEFFDHLIEQQGTVASHPLQMSADRVARKTLRAVRRGRRELILSASGRGLVAANKILPGLLSRLLSRLGGR
jgi:short-subunit dehydrogenase